MKIKQLIKDYLKRIAEALEEDGMHSGCPLCKPRDPKDDKDK